MVILKESWHYRAARWRRAQTLVSSLACRRSFDVVALWVAVLGQGRTSSRVRDLFVG